MRKKKRFYLKKLLRVVSYQLPINFNHSNHQQIHVRGTLCIEISWNLIGAGRIKMSIYQPLALIVSKNQSIALDASPFCDIGTYTSN